MIYVGTILVMFAIYFTPIVALFILSYLYYFFYYWYEFKHRAYMRKRASAMSGDNADKVTLGDIHDKTLEDIVGWDYFILDGSLLPDVDHPVWIPVINWLTLVGYILGVLIVWILFGLDWIWKHTFGKIKFKKIKFRLGLWSAFCNWLRNIEV